MQREGKLPLVSVIVSTYHRPQLLQLALQSILNQTFADFEVLVVGDHCTDTTQEVVTAFKDPRIAWLNLPKRVGNQSGPNNEGLRLAKGKYIAYLGHDDLWFPWHLANLIHALEAKTEFGFALTAMVYPKEVVKAYGTPEPGRNILYHHAPPSSWLHAKSLTKQVGFWQEKREELVFTIDRDFFYRAVKAGVVPQFVPSLSVIKFPSPSWKTYALTRFPQEQVAQALFVDPHLLHTDLLTKIAVHSALHIAERRSKLRKIACALFDHYGRERWPLSTWMNRKIKKEIRKGLEKRGLRE